VGKSGFTIDINTSSVKNMNHHSRFVNYDTDTRQVDMTLPHIRY